MKKLKSWVRVPIALGAAVCLMGTSDCEGLHHGGGFVEKLDGSKAKFGYQVSCKELDDDDVCQKVSGMVQLNDHAAGVAFHGVVTGHRGLCLFEPDASEHHSAWFEGTYSSQPVATGDGGTFSFCAKDFGEPGLHQDQITVRVESGVYAGYSLEFEVIDGGNIQFKELPGPPE